MTGVVTVALALFVGFATVRLLMIVAPDLLRAPALTRANYRDQMLPTVGGLLVVLAVLVVAGARVGLGAVGVGKRPALDGTRPLVLLVCVGFGLLGLLDDLLASGDDRGFAGHLRALAGGRVTTGLIKLAGGGALALVVADARGPEGRAQLFADAAVIALAANLGNLFDRRPGRALKVGFVAWIPIAIIAGSDALGVAMAPVIGAFLATLPDDLDERLMLGDAGANVLGAVLGLGVVLETSTSTRVVVLCVLVALNAASEWISFGRVIHRFGVLRRVDELGRRFE
jgi:UDP-N-acetylmuramyl pentapeptide phosphotransferase/UDP-N-acetylglucosamine-1-phosphate transferase